MARIVSFGRAARTVTTLFHGAALLRAVGMVAPGGRTPSHGSDLAVLACSCLALWLLWIASLEASRHLITKPRMRYVYVLCVFAAATVFAPSGSLPEALLRSLIPFLFLAFLVLWDGSADRSLRSSVLIGLLAIFVILAVLHRQSAQSRLLLPDSVPTMTLVIITGASALVVVDRLLRYPRSQETRTLAVALGAGIVPYAVIEVLSQADILNTLNTVAPAWFPLLIALGVYLYYRHSVSLEPILTHWGIGVLSAIVLVLTSWSSPVLIRSEILGVWWVSLVFELGAVLLAAGVYAGLSRLNSMRRPPIFADTSVRSWDRLANAVTTASLHTIGRLEMQLSQLAREVHPPKAGEASLLWLSRARRECSSLYRHWRSISAVIHGLGSRQETIDLYYLLRRAARRSGVSVSTTPLRAASVRCSPHDLERTLVNVLTSARRGGHLVTMNVTEVRRHDQLELRLHPTYAAGTQRLLFRRSDSLSPRLAVSRMLLLRRGGDLRIRQGLHPMYRVLLPIPHERALR